MNTPAVGAARPASPRDPARRSFMAVSLCTPAAAAGALLGLAPAPSVPTVAAAGAAPAPQGYHLTEHIRDYYASARY